MSGQELTFFIVFISAFLFSCGQTGDLSLPPSDQHNKQNQKIT